MISRNTGCREGLESKPKPQFTELKVLSIILLFAYMAIIGLPSLTHNSLQDTALFFYHAIS